MSQPLVSVCVPTYFCGGEQQRILRRLIKSAREQTYPNFELVISDQEALPENGEHLVEFLDAEIQVKYLAFQDDSGKSAHNTNNALAHATGEFVQILNHDDFYYHPEALASMVDRLQTTGAGWLASACMHTDANETKLERLHVPRWPGEKNMVEAQNNIGCPSVVLFKRELGLKCDPDIVYGMDCDLWIQAFRAGGEPAILSDPAVVIRMWESQFTNQLNVPKQLELDKSAMRKKYDYT